MASITNIKGQKPDPISEVDTLEQAVNSAIVKNDSSRQSLVESIKDIVSQFKRNQYNEIDDRDVKFVDVILLRNEKLLKQLFNGSTSVDNITTTMDLNIDGCLDGYYEISKDKKQLKWIKETIVKNLLEALEEYAKLVQSVSSNVKVKTETIVKEKVVEVEKQIEVEKNIYQKVIDENQNVDNYDVVEKYLINVQNFMRDLYAKKLNERAKLKSKETKSKNLIVAAITTNIIKNPEISNKITKPKLDNKINNILNKPKKSKKNFKESLDFNKLGLKGLWKNNLKNILKTSLNFVVKGVKLSLNKVKKVIGNVIQKAKKIINKIKGTIIKFALGLIPFVGPIIKFLIPVLKVIMFTIKLGIKLITFAIKFITALIKILFTGLFKVMKFAILSPIKIIKGAIGRIKTILSSPLVAQIFKFLFTTPPGMFIVGYIVGFAWKNWIQPFWEKIEQWRNSDDETPLKEKITNKITEYKDRLKAKYDGFINRFAGPGTIIDKVITFFTDFKYSHVRTLFRETKIKIDRDIVTPTKKFFKGLICFFVGMKGRAIAGKIIKIIGKLCRRIPYIGPFVEPILAICAGAWEIYFSKSSSKEERDELTERKNNLLKLYGANSLRKQDDHTDLIQLQTEANGDDKNYSAEFKAKLKKKIEAQKKIGVTTSKQSDFIDDLRSQIKDEIAACEPYRKYSRKMCWEEKDEDKLNDIFSTKIPFPSGFDPSTGEFKEFSTDFTVLNDMNPIAFRLIRAKMLQDKINEYDNGILSYDDLSQYIRSIMVKTPDGKMAFNQKLLAESQETSEVNLNTALTSDEQDGWFADSAINALYKEVNEDKSGKRTKDLQNKIDIKKQKVDSLVAKFINQGLLDIYRKDYGDRYQELVDSLSQALMREDLDEFIKKSNKEKTDYVLNLMEGLVSEVNADAEIQKNQEAREKAEEEEAELAQEQAELKQQKNPDKKEEQNSQTIKSINQEKMPSEQVQQSNQEFKKQLNNTAEAKSTEAQKIQTENVKKQEADVNNTKSKLDNVLDKISENIQRLKNPKESVAALPSLEDAVQNDAARESVLASKSQKLFNI